MNLDWLLLVLGLAVTEASCCLFNRIYEVVKQEPRPAIHMEKKLGWAGKLGAVESPAVSKAGSNSVSHVDGVSGMAQLVSSVGGRFSKGIMAFAHLDARHFSFSLYTTGALQADTLVLEHRESESQ